LSTGPLGLDIALGVGGLPRGRVGGLRARGFRQEPRFPAGHRRSATRWRHGPRSSDAEHALDPSYAEKLGVNIQRSAGCPQPDTGEQALEITDMLVRSNGGRHRRD